ncbi:MAG: mannosyltransferase [Tannerella sp.]|jgi:phosphatidylinositol glycan class B|nr:mannosyltransferase [Tannerella sp.]
MKYKRKAIIYFAVAVIYLLTALHSSGFHHRDEHFQVIECAGLKGGWNTGADLPWEYDCQIRPILQPMIALTIIKTCGFFGLDDPYLQATALRLLTAILSVFCIALFIRAFLPDIQKKYQDAFIVLSFLLWFLPAVNVRFSSEVWAGAFFLLSTALLYSSKSHSTIAYFGIGILCGLSFEFRFQIAIAIVGLMLWLLFVKKMKICHLTYILLGCFFVIVCCTALDSWYYGNWVFAPWNYFQTNMITDGGVASSFGVSPWYYYLEQIINRPVPFIGVVIAAAIISLLITDYKHVIVWILVPFILFHSLIPHKELRFLFPIVNFIPLLLILACQHISKRWYVLYPILTIILIINTGGLLMMSFKPASNGNIAMAEYIHKQTRNTNTVYLYAAYGNPYIAGTAKGLYARFYNNPKVKIIDFSYPTDEELSSLQNMTYWIVLPEFAVSEQNAIKSKGFAIEKRSMPALTGLLNRFYKVYPQEQTLLLYKNVKNFHSVALSTR